MQREALNGGKRLAVAGCKHTTLDLVRALRRTGYRIDHCLTLTPEQKERHQVSGYMDLRPHLEGMGIPYTIAPTYGLNTPEDRRALEPIVIDLMAVVGWQRLIPAWLLERIPLGAYGMHGSSRPLPHGRGRSPMNWSIITGRDRFYTHLIRYTPGVDEGPIVGQVMFQITPEDTALTCHKKNQVAMVRLLCEHLPALLRGEAKPTPQPSQGASYWPKRSPEDGLIDWAGSAEAICRLVRGTAWPFPGAFSFLDDDPAHKVILWRAQPFDAWLTYPQAAPGEIVEVFFDGTWVARCRDASVLVTESEEHSFTEEDLGRRLGCAGMPIKQWTGLPD